MTQFKLLLQHVKDTMPESVAVFSTELHGTTLGYKYVLVFTACNLTNSNVEVATKRTG